MDISISSLMVRGPPAITTSYSLTSDDQGCTGSKAEKHCENEHFVASEFWEIYPDMGVGPDSHFHSIFRPEPSVPAVSCCLGLWPSPLLLCKQHRRIDKTQDVCL